MEKDYKFSANLTYDSYIYWRKWGHTNNTDYSTQTVFKLWVRFSVFQAGPHFRPVYYIYIFFFGKKEGQI